MTTYTVDTKNIDLLGKTVSNKYRKLIPRVRQSTLNRVAFEAVKDQKAEMPKALDRPTKQTVNSVLAFRASKPTDEFSAVYIREFASAYLNPNITGETLTEMYGRPQILVPNIRNLERQVVRKILRIKDIVKEIDGNIIRSPRSKIMRKIINNPHTFVVNVARDHLVPGIYLRFRQGLFTLFTFEKRVQRKAKYHFGETANDTYNQNFRRLWVKSFREAAGKVRR